MTPTAALRLVIAAGGTGGHLYPGIAVARRFLARCPDTDVHFIGHAGGLEERLLPREGFALTTVQVQALKGRSRLAQVQALAVLGLGTWQALRVLRQRRPHLVLGAGGYVMGPVILAATLLRVPRVIMEQNLIPGLTVRGLARYAHRVFTSFPESADLLPGRSVTYTGTPVREEIADVGAAAPAPAHARLHLFVFGGSQGAHRLNQAMMQAAPLLAAAQTRLQIVHQTGEADHAAVTQAYAQAGLHAEVQPFLYDMAARYRWADLVICRSGASTLAELTACGKPAILVPYPYAADDHQRHNAMALQRQGAAQILLDADCTGTRLVEMLEPLLHKPALLQQQAVCSRSLGRPYAAL
ncbi:MAG: undecaprenyldiphospho-muramoylpentapeptide beta-N-acetylglucosaminyltransferase [Candidatus Tectomicrobia bacterium]|uniref:UDP-N-acetylglucosamine--N-acetylmuramyl-(pentapeptide) pyrophosphoryl-undecaprenol N-acetylglucosamine transferase n=1 Tax=Tectimicrobiota bacterium TaxID=2528274 RepID=A0A938B075_UNCTE|nr:undecaprenyldiphospho-muramoylpentapeptide beta-N-acetylglucosaminyltransferase [Candidatus Tectomicrobia bacterium]